MERCYLCGETEYEIIHRGVRGNPDINVLRCNNCGLIRLSKFIQNADEFYRNSGMWRWKEKCETTELDMIRNETMYDDLRRFKFTRERILNKTVCDFGCGAGGYLLYAQTVASEVYGIELETAMCNNFGGG